MILLFFYKKKETAMKKNFTCKFLILIFGVIGLANAQRVVPIAPTSVGIINTVINGDTLANGDRVDPNTIYELERGENKYYVFNGTISNVDYHLHIRSAGEGDRPKLVPGVLSGGVAERLFTPRGDITLEGLYISGMDNTNVSSFNHMMSVAAENIRVTIDDCVLHGNRSNCFELDAQNQSAYVTNSILSYTFLNGRGIDRRGNQLDTLVVQNSTFINIGSEPLRWGGSNYAKYIKFDHVTWCATGESIGNFGEVVDFTFTNNLIINAGYKGTEDDGSPSRIFNIEPITSPDLSGETQSITVRNNNLWLDPQLANLYGNLDVSSGSNNFPVMARPFGDSLTHVLIDTTTFLNEPILFTYGPSADTLMAALRQIWETLDGDRDGLTIFDTGPEGVNIYGNPLYGIFPFDLSYSTTTQSYTAGDNGLPLGDLKWFPDKYNEWLVTDVSDTDFSPNSFSLNQNYPNPFNPSTIISFTLEKPGLATLSLFNILGQKVSTLVSKEFEGGNHSINFDASTLPSGVYFYRLESGDFVAVKKMMLLK
jgi:hypothetical protein